MPQAFSERIFSGKVYDLNKREHIITLHTFSKALGSFGAFISCNQTIKEYLVNKCRSFIYTTAPPALAYGPMDGNLRCLKGRI